MPRKTNLSFKIRKGPGRFTGIFFAYMYSHIAWQTDQPALYSETRQTLPLQFI